ncbi:NAD-dependent epimerase/dehydratase family protein [Kocuria rosea]|uniref:NAD-dependent epimerase/dehydratase family protein n=1 Tax=Kocuria rosea TaxID=1275 RepID=UPI001F545EEF|nr:NAD-dependent epimerase/dehydratase family protein [Kocuria rosea]
MRVAVTGGAGFLGSHLCLSLLARGDHVICVDDLSTGRAENVSTLQQNENFLFLHQDVSRGLDVEGGLDVVAHLASPASPVDYHRLPLHTLATGSRGTENALGLAKKAGARFLLASTSEVYGDPLEHPQREKYYGNVSSTGPRSVYDEAKRFSEAITMAYARTLDVNAGIVRIVNTYGPLMRADDGRVVSSFIVQALNGDPLTIYGNGEQTRSFCYVGDLVRGLLAMIDSNERGPINLGNPSEVTVFELAQLVLGVTQSESSIEFYPIPTDDPGRRCPDIASATRHLSWEPRISIEEGVRRTVDYFRRQHREVSEASEALRGPQTVGLTADAGLHEANWLSQSL